MTRMEYIIKNECFITRPLLRTDDFVRYCKARNIAISTKELEKFEELRLFYPLTRVRYPKNKIKVKYINDGKQYKHLGILKDAEKWSGDTIEEYAQFLFEKEYALSWLEDGYLWEPSSQPFQEWKTFRDAEGYRQVESFYSVFQCYELYSLLGLIKINVNAVNLLNNISISNIRNWATVAIERCKLHANKENVVPYICQVLSNRYYPETQTDRRTINVSFSGFSYHNWDWDKYCRCWNAKTVLDDLKINLDELAKLHKIISRQISHIDPLEKWYELVNFISVDKKKKLKGNALFAQSLYAIEHMLRLFYKDLTNKELSSPDESLYFDKNRFYGTDTLDNELKYLEYVTNQYNLNPKPKLILALEGNGEKEQLPHLAKNLFGSSFSTLGIEVINIYGVGNFEGRKITDKYGAWEKFIDYYHSRQTIVFIILDNEGRVSAIKNRLTKATSKFYPKRTVTKDEYIHLWRQNIEFDNFNSSEIARAMTKLGKDKYSFTTQEIEDCKKEFGKTKNPLGNLFVEKVAYDMEKPKLLEILFSFVISNSKDEFDDRKNPKRDLVKILLKIIDLARGNYQPVTNEMWEKNQKSGWFGDIIK